MLPDRVSNPGPLTYESGAQPIALCGPFTHFKSPLYVQCQSEESLISSMTVRLDWTGTEHIKDNCRMAYNICHNSHFRITDVTL